MSALSSRCIRNVRHASVTPQDDFDVSAWQSLWQRAMKMAGRYIKFSSVWLIGMVNPSTFLR